MSHRFFFRNKNSFNLMCIKKTVLKKSLKLNLTKLTNNIKYTASFMQIL